MNHFPLIRLSSPFVMMAFFTYNFGVQLLVCCFQDGEKYERLAKDCVTDWEQRMYSMTDEDPHYIR